jgi:hypothetical protein
MNKLVLPLTLFASFNLGANPSHAPAQLRLEVRASQSLFEPFPNEEEIRLSFRSTEAGYLTLYHIHPDSGLAILYPQPHHRWLELQAKKEYRLSELAEDLRLEYEGLDGYIYLGMIVTPEPIHLVPWLEQAFEEEGIRAGAMPEILYADELERVIEKVEADVRFRMGEAQAGCFALVPLLVRPRIQLLTEERRDPLRPQRYFYAGRYHVVEPELPPDFSSSARRAPFIFSPRLSQPNAIAPSSAKEKNKPPQTPRRERKK